MDLIQIKNFFKTYKIEISVVLFTFVISSLVFIFTNLRFPNDDQFILYRYIDNIVLGKGFVYNIGDRVLGATTPLFTILCAFFKFLLPAVSTPTIVAGVNIVLLSFGALFFFKVCRFFLSEKISLLAVLVFAFNLSRTIPEGMETPLFILTSMVFVFALFSKRLYLSSVFLSLSILTRPDAGLIAVLALLYWLYKTDIRTSIRLTTVCIAVALPWLVFATIYFGSFIPQSLATKLHSHDIYNLSSIQGFKIQIAHLSRVYWGKIFDPDNIVLQTVFNLMPMLVLLFLGIKKFIRKDTLIFFAIPFAYFVSFSISNPIIFPWYLSQMEPFWIIISIIGLSVILDHIKNKYVKIFVCLLIIVGPCVSWVNTIVSDNQGSKMAAFEVGEYIKEHKEASDSVGLADIGIVGFVSEARVIDFIGLVNSDSVYYYPIKDTCVDKSELYVIPPRLIMEKKPDWLVAGKSSLTSCFYEGEWFAKNYELVKVIGGASIWKLNK